MAKHQKPGQIVKSPSEVDEDLKNFNYRRFLQSPGAPIILILVSVASLAGLGLIMVFSASSVNAYQTTGATYSIFVKQLAFTALGLIALYIGTRKKTKIWELLTKNSLALGILLLILPLSPLGKTINGNRDWIGFGSFTFQPSELGKVLLILWSASQIGKYQERIAAGRMANPLSMLATGPLIFIGLDMAGSDLGTAGVYAGIALTMIYLSGVSRSLISSITLGGFAIATAFILATPYRVKRFTAVLNPFAPNVYQFAGWQPAHSIMGLASGGFFGVGLGAGKQKWANLSEAPTDFIFSVIGEELGLLGTLIVVALFITLIYAIFRVAISTPDVRAKFMVTGVAVWFGLQGLINMGTATGIFPVVGVTLPFVSYGGSSLLADYIAIGLVLYIANKDPRINLKFGNFRKKKSLKK